jgi:hypothetical protein
MSTKVGLGAQLRGTGKDSQPIREQQPHIRFLHMVGERSNQLDLRQSVRDGAFRRRIDLDATADSVDAALLWNIG